MRLNHVTIDVTDLARSVEFYRALGLRQIVADSSYSRFTCPDGDSTFSLELVDGHVPASSALIYFECDDLDQRVEELKARGIRFDQEPIDQPWLWREARLRDPDGHALCLFLAGENRLNPPWRLT
jgi:catechol 2,3-dioxygenase-like lactoylglutathione lyase family enzyme